MAKRSKVKTEKKQENRGRPRKEVNWATFEYLCSIQCRMGEIAGALLMDMDTLQARCKEHYGKTCGQAMEEFSANGLASLRRAQWDEAVNKRDPSLLKHLSKNHLGMHDRIESRVEMSGNIQTSTKSMEDVKKVHSDPVAKRLSMELAERLLELEEKETQDVKVQEKREKG